MENEKRENILKERFRRAYENNHLLKRFMNEEEFNQSLKSMKPKIMSLYDPKASQAREDELNKLREKYFDSTITKEEENRLNDLERDPSGLIYTDLSVPTGGFHGLWVFDRLVENLEINYILNQKIKDYKMDKIDKKLFKDLMEVRYVGKDFEKIYMTLSQDYRVSKRELKRLMYIQDRTHTNMFGLSNVNTSDVQRVIMAILSIEMLYLIADQNQSQTIQVTKIDKIKREYLKMNDENNLRGLIGELQLIAILAKSNILREMEKKSANGKRPDLQVEIINQLVEIEIFSLGLPSKLFSLTKRNSKQFQTAKFLSEDILVNKLIGSKIGKEQLSQLLPGIIFIYSAYGIEDFDEYDDFLRNEINYHGSTKSIEFPNFKHGKNVFENINAIVVSDILDIKNIRQNCLHRTFETANYSKNQVDNIIEELVNIMNQGGNDLASEVIKELELILHNYDLFAKAAHEGSILKKINNLKIRIMRRLRLFLAGWFYDAEK